MFRVLIRPHIFNDEETGRENDDDDDDDGNDAGATRGMLLLLPRGDLMRSKLR